MSEKMALLYISKKSLNMSGFSHLLLHSICCGIFFSSSKIHLERGGGSILGSLIDSCGYYSLTKHH